MASDGAAFFPTVLRNDVFQRDGLLFGFEHIGGLPVHWAVVDPERHAMYVWRKRTSSYLKSALDLGAPLFTNGPFGNYGGRNLPGSTLAYTTEFLTRVSGATMGKKHASCVGRPSRHLVSELKHLSVRHFQAEAPLGFVIGSREGIFETSVSRPRVFYFGRRGLAFEDYVISRGDPADVVEAVGGLFGSVRGYEPYSVDRFIRVGYWGLAPLVSDPILQRNGVDDALDQYLEARGPAARCPGLLFTAAGWANTQRLARLLAAIRVKDAVQIDSGDSLLLGGARTLRQGTLMPPWKRLLQCWGLQFRSRLEVGESGTTHELRRMP